MSGEIQKIENKLIEKMGRRSGKTNMTQEAYREMIIRNYVPVVMDHIAKHGCSGLKCKRCPLNNICDRNAAKSKELANQMIAYANSHAMSKKVDTEQKNEG